MSLINDAPAIQGKVAPGEQTDSRYRETLLQRLNRWVLGTAWSLKPKRIRGAPATLGMVIAHYLGLLDDTPAVPDSEKALKVPDGLAGICDELDVDSLIGGYRAGLFPHGHIGPMKWWAPSSRMVLRLEDFHMEKNLKRLLRKKIFRVTFDTAFEDVVFGCAEPRSGRYHLTWITPRVAQAFIRLFESGHAHSVEVWDEDGNLVGGAFGVIVGSVFCTESQFSRKSNASKIGFATLNCHLQKWGFQLNDGKGHTTYLEQCGFKLMPRATYNSILSQRINETIMPGAWRIDESLDPGNWDPSLGSAQFTDKAEEKVAAS